MATDKKAPSAKDEKHDDEERDEHDAPEEVGKEDKGKPAAESKPATAKDESTDEDEGDDEGDEGDDEGDEDDEEDEAPKQAAKPAAKAVAAKRPPVRRPPPAQGSFGKSMLLFVVIVGGLGAAFYALSGTEASGPAQPKWKVGETANVEITLVGQDVKELACGSAQAIGDRKCAFDDKKKPVAGADADDKKLLRPYTTTDGVQFLAAGLWSEPALKDKLPATRFAVKCKYVVDGMSKKPAVRWSEQGPWYDQHNEWFAGHVEGCTLVATK